MRLPRLLRTTSFRLTLLSLAVFAGAASAFLVYVYLATAGDVRNHADAQVQRNVDALQRIYAQGGLTALNQAVIERASQTNDQLYLLMNGDGTPISGSIGASPIKEFDGKPTWATFQLTEPGPQGQSEVQAARGLEIQLSGGQRLFVGADVGEAEAYVGRILHALWGAGALTILLGLLGGLLISRNASRSMASLVGVIDQARGGDLAARAQVRGAGDEYDELAVGLNDMLDRLERSIASIRHAGDAIAHDLRSPLTRLRARLEAAIIEADAGRTDPREALHQALDDTDGVLRTFAAVLSIARLESAADPPGQTVFDAAELALSVAELYGPVAEDKGLDFQVDAAPGLKLIGNREFIAQAVANLLDNAAKYTPSGGAIRLAVRRRASGDVEISVTDTGPGIDPADRERVVQRFVRLEHSRHQPGAGLGLSLVAAVARAHKGGLEIDEGPGSVEGSGPGLRAALVFPPV
ncbi:MAG: HAMP domain-containing histidine kinase [Alphaproteobacteria bacterium]|jgi:signal transduction histidine kinase|nr:HAMP domain-containing histidine kinase [Alphaproteobacteria bacterium]